MSSIFNIGMTSLFASEYALTVANQNIANAENPFYTRRIVDFQEANISGLGEGVKLLDVQRVYDKYINQSLLNNTSSYASANSYYQEMKSFEPLLDDNTTSVDAYIKKSLDQLNNLNVNASSMQARNMVLAQLNNMATRFNQVSSDITTDHANARQTIAADVEAVNDITDQIGQINSLIAQAGDPLAAENLPLMDERDRLMSQMAEYLHFNSSTDVQGMTNITLDNGVPLVIGTRASTLTTAFATDDSNRYDIVLQSPGASEVITSLITGGKIAGLLSYQENGLEAAERGLSRLALAIAINMNTQNKLGSDLDGNLGSDLFNDMNDATLSTNRVIPFTNNTGSGTLSVNIDDVTQLTTSDYQLSFSTGTTYQLIRSADGQVMSSGDVSSVPYAISADGFTLNITAASFQAGDDFTVSPTRGAASQMSVNITDARQLALAFPVATSPSETNKGDGVITLNSITDVSTPDFAVPGALTPPILIQFTTPTLYSVINATDSSVIEANVVYDPTVGGSVFPTSSSYDPGYRVSLSGEMQTGDSFNINYNQSGVGDNRNGLLLADLYQNQVLDNGTLNFSQGYHAVSGDISSKTNVAQMMDNAQGILKTQAALRRDQVSGVSLEEEALNVARYQQSYEASAKILETMTRMFDVVLNMVGR